MEWEIGWIDGMGCWIGCRLQDLRYPRYPPPDLRFGGHEGHVSQEPRLSDPGIGLNLRSAAASDFPMGGEP